MYLKDQWIILKSSFNARCTNSELEVVKGVCVEDFQFSHQSDGELHHGAHEAVRHVLAL